MAVGTRMQQRRATAAVWATSGYILAPGEIGVTTDTGIMKVGNGTSPWSSLGIAFETQYLPLLGTAANASLLGGVGPSSYVKFADTTTAATANKVPIRDSSGRIKAVAGVATDDVVNLSQLTSSLVSRTVTSSFTLDVTDAGKMIIGNSSAYGTSLVCNVPANSAIAFPIGSFVDIVAGDKGPIVLTPAGGVTISGNIPVYGGGSSVRIVKTGTDTWRVVNVSLSPPPLLHRNIKPGSDNAIGAGGFVTLRLDAADNSAHPYSDNKDTLGAGEQWSSAANTKCYCRRSGYYDVRTQISITGTAYGRLFIEAYFNGNGGGDYLGGGISLGNMNDTSAQFSSLIPINVGDYMEVAAYQDGVSGAQIQQQAYVNSFVEWVWRRPL